MSRLDDELRTVLRDFRHGRFSKTEWIVAVAGFAIGLIILALLVSAS